ncbi:MAG: PD-(D/E)XK nuclease family protein [Anaerolineales bacterium]|nr:PD-(D/E)XK nuclease family protein [Anaerolineales bacterium]
MKPPCGSSGRDCGVWWGKMHKGTTRPIEMDEVKLLLEKIRLINSKYEKELQAIRFEFNIFSVLNLESDEVNLHSRFLFEFLNPKGSHFQRDYFLDILLKQIGILKFELKNVSVKREYHNIDILITNSQMQAIIIENKIYAGDQLQQLERYHRIIEDKGYKDIEIVYLTLYGDEPSDESRGKLSSNVIKTISYKDDIVAWLNHSLKAETLKPAIREILIQYQSLIKKLTGQYFPEEYIMEIKELLIDEKNIEVAVVLSQAVVEAKIDIQFAFWQELERGLKEAGYKIIDYQKYSKDLVRKYYTSRRNNRYYGIMFELVSNLGDSSKLLFFVELGSYIYYGFTILKDNRRNIVKLPQYDYLAEIVKAVNADFKRDEWWIGKKDPARKYDFETFDSPDVFALANPSRRAECANELVDEIKKLVNDFSHEYGNRVPPG